MTATWRAVGTGETLKWVVTKQSEYDAMGAVKISYAPYQTGDAGEGVASVAESPTSAVTQFDYMAPFGIDPTNRVRSVTTPDLESTTTQYAAAWTHVIDQEGNKSSTQVDFLGRERARLLYTGLSTLEMQYSYAYDGLDRLLTTTVGNSTTTKTWDALGRMRQVIDPDSGTWDTRFDLSGNPILQDDPKSGQRVESCYDLANRVVLQCSYPSDGTSIATSCGSLACGTGGVEIARYWYDSQPFDSDCGGPGQVGQLAAVADESGGECFAYDMRGRVVTQKKRIVFNSVSTTAKTVFTFDDADHLTTIQYPDDASGANPVEHGYQPDGYPESIEQIIGGVEYDLFGRATKITSLRDTEDLVTYDTTGSQNFRLQGVQTKKLSTPTSFLNLAYSYWPRGKVKNVIDSRDAGTARSNGAGYCYDGIGRLVRVVRDPGLNDDPCSGVAEESFGHDPNGNLSAINGTNFGFTAGPHQPTSFGAYSSISYDANGNRSVKSKGGGTQDDFIYDARGLLTHATRFTSGSLTSSQTNVYDYAGNRVVRAPSQSTGVTTIRTYNRFADASGGNLTRFYYLGKRLVATHIVAAPTLSEVDPGQLIPSAPTPLPAEFLVPVGALLLLLVFAPFGGEHRLGVRVSLSRASSVSLIFIAASAPVVLVSGCVEFPTVRLLHVDHLGSTQVVTDWHGDIYRQMRYTAYGQIRGRFGPAGLSTGPTQDSRFEFTGYESDFAGLAYAGARFLDPELGQFASHDPAGQFPSPYAYGPGDPINGIDPTGADFWGLIFAGVLIGLAATAQFVDTYVETGDPKAAARAFGTSMTGSLNPGFGLVESIRNDQVGQYLSNFALGTVTLGIYGTVQSFENGQYASGAVGVLQVVYSAYSVYSSSTSTSDAVSGNQSAGQASRSGGAGGVWSGVGNVAGKLWNLPNTVVGLAYGAVGAIIDGVVQVATLGRVDLGFGISIGNNAIQFTNHPLQELFGGGAITLGNTIAFGGSPRDSAPTSVPFTTVPIGSHERAHTFQGQVLGPLYLPANIIGGVAGTLGTPFTGPGPGGSAWHGSLNFMERGPSAVPPRAWP